MARAIYLCACQLIISKTFYVIVVVLFLSSNLSFFMKSETPLPRPHEIPGYATVVYKRQSNSSYEVPIFLIIFPVSCMTVLYTDLKS